MKRRFVIRPRAEADQASHFHYLAEQNPAAAHRFLDAVEEALAKIHKDPGFGANVVVLRHEGQDIRFYRPRGFDAYVIYFRVTNDAVIVLRILHGSQDTDRAFEA